MSVKKLVCSYGAYIYLIIIIFLSVGLTEREFSVIAVVDYIILSSSAVQLLREIVEVWRRKVAYFYDLENFVELPMFILTITFCVGLDNK